MTLHTAKPAHRSDKDSLPSDWVRIAWSMRHAPGHLSQRVTVTVGGRKLSTPALF